MSPKLDVENGRNTYHRVLIRIQILLMALLREATIPDIDVDTRTSVNDVRATIVDVDMIPTPTIIPDVVH